MPSGPITWEVVIWLVTVLIGGITGASTVFGIGWRVYAGLVKRIGIVEQEAADKIAAADARAKMAEKELAETVAAYQVHAAETFATKSGMTTAVERVEEAMTRLSGQLENAFERLSGRIDRLLESRSDPHTPRPRRPSQ